MVTAEKTPVPAPVTPRESARLWPWLVLAAVVVVFRSAIFVWHGTLAFDGDQAVVGLMAKHAAEGRAFPVFQYALPYVLMVSAWLAVPFMWVMGPTIAALKTPLLLMNVAVGVWLVRATIAAGVRPAVAVVLSLPLLAVAPITAAHVMDALGMTIEPLVVIALLWITRGRPLLFGLVAGLGFLVREFAAYGVAAVLLTEVLTGRVSRRADVQRWALALLGFLATVASVQAVGRFASVAGPGTTIAQLSGGNLDILSGAFCFAPQQALTNIAALGQWYLGLVFGAVPARVSDGAVQTAVRQGAPWLWPLLAVALVLMLVRLASRWRAAWALRAGPAVTLAVFLAAVGTQAFVVYAVSRCTLISVLTMRYALLGLLLPTGVALAWYVVEPSRRWRAALLAAFGLVATVNLSAHTALWAEQVAQPHVSNRAQLAAALEQRGVRYARSDYWTAYYVTFLTEERIVVGSTVFSRIQLYEHLLARQPGPVPTVATSPCGDAPPVAPGYWLCE